MSTEETVKTREPLFTVAPGKEYDAGLLASRIRSC
jgi:hypothetical protein